MFFKRRENQQFINNKVLERANGRAVKYVSYRDEDGVEIILGKNGRIVANDTEIAIICNGKDVFCCDRETASVSELMSLEGLRIDGIVNGEKQSVTAFYTYYRK